MKNKRSKISKSQRKMRIYQALFIAVSIIVLLSMILSMVAQ